MGTNGASDASAAKKPRRGVWRWLRRIYRAVKVLVLVVILLAVGYVLLHNHLGEKRLEEVLATLRARGLPTTLGALSAAETTAADTADGTRYYLAAFELARYVPGVQESDVPYVGSGAEPQLCKPIDPELAAKLGDFVDQHANFFALFEKARGCRRFHYDIRVLTADFGGLDAVAGMRSATRFQLLKCLHEQARGEPAKALGACEGILDLSVSFRSGPQTIVFLTRSLVGISVIEAAEHTLSRTTPAVDDLESLRAKMLATAQSLDPREPIRAEVAILAEEAQHVQRSMARTTYLYERVLSSGGYASVSGIYEEFGLGGPYPSAATARAINNGARVWAMLCPGAYRISFARQIDRTVEDYDLASQSTVDLATHANAVLAEEGAESERAGWMRALLMFVAARARMKVGAAAMAVECYRIRNGTWPDALADLDLKEADATDPFDGKALKYEKTQDGCVVYSVGENQRDDGGVSDPSQETGDIVFRLFDAAKRNTP